MSGGAGNDHFTGGAGADAFRFEINRGSAKILIQAANFGLAAGAPAPPSIDHNPGLWSPLSPYHTDTVIL